MKKFAPALLASLIFSACAPSTPQTRIQRSPEKFAALSQSEQSLVQRGQLARGMSADAVLLAWGAPDRRYEGFRNALPTERWDYLADRPIYTHSSFGYYGYGSRAYSHFGMALEPDVIFVPYQYASAWFIKGRVDAWERGR